MEQVYKITFEKPVSIVTLSDGIVFSDGTSIRDVHAQDCCENVYADWSSLADTTILDKKFKTLEITGNPSLGIVINGEFAVNCYNEQNGYYSSNLALVINRPNKPEISIDISNFVADDIY